MASTWCFLPVSSTSVTWHRKTVTNRTAAGPSTDWPVKLDSAPRLEDSSLPVSWRYPNIHLYCKRHFWKIVVNQQRNSKTIFQRNQIKFDCSIVPVTCSTIQDSLNSNLTPEPITSVSGQVKSNSIGVTWIHSDAWDDEPSPELWPPVLHCLNVGIGYSPECCTKPLSTQFQSMNWFIFTFLKPRDIDIFFFNGEWATSVEKRGCITSPSLPPSPPFYHFQPIKSSIRLINRAFFLIDKWPAWIGCVSCNSCYFQSSIWQFSSIRFDGMNFGWGFV